MIFGAGIIVFSKDAEADRLFFRDVLGLASVDAGGGWLVFALPPTEAAFHPSDKNDAIEFYFMCENLKSEMATLRAKGVQLSEVEKADWGSLTRIRLPGGGQVGLYEPRHRTAIEANR